MFLALYSDTASLAERSDDGGRGRDGKVREGSDSSEHLRAVPVDRPGQATVHEAGVGAGSVQGGGSRERAGCTKPAWAPVPCRPDPKDPVTGVCGHEGRGVVVSATISYMPQPTSLRLPEAVKRRLDAAADRERVATSAVAVRLIDEGLRMAEHPGVVFHDSQAHGRVATLSNGPDISEIIDVLTGLEARGEEWLAETAEWFGLHVSRIRVAVDYYADHRGEIDDQIDRRHREAAEQRGRYEVSQALLE